MCFPKYIFNVFTIKEGKKMHKKRETRAEETALRPAPTTSLPCGWSKPQL